MKPVSDEVKTILDSAPDLLALIHRIASDAWSTTGNDRALKLIAELTTAPEINNTPEPNRL